MIEFPADLKAIQEFDTCAILNAIEVFGVRLRNEGYAKPGLLWLFPGIPSIIGFACTMRVKSSNPPLRGSVFEDRTDWWRDIAAHQPPSIAVVEDIDENAGVGSVAGGVHAAIMHRLGCTGLVTNGSVRDLHSVEPTGFAFMAGSVWPSHAYGHVVSHSEAVKIGGLQIEPGDLLYADRHGLITVPVSLVPELPAVAAKLREKDKRIQDYCRSPQFTLEGLEDLVK